jgi:hypothetical protein
MPCLHCGAEKTIEAHLIPQAFVREVKRDRGEQHLLIHQGRDRPIVSNTGVFDRDILCTDCDGVLGRYEGYAHALLKRLRTIRVPAGTIVPVDPIDGDMMVRFAAGIAWKFAVTQPDRGQLSLGPYPAILARVALGGGPIPASIDVAMIRIIELDGDVYYYRAPLPDRQDDANVVRFCVGSFVFFLKIDKRRNGRTLPLECWLRGRTTGAFLTVPAELFEEGKLHAKLAGRPPARQFFQEMLTRRRGGRS